MEHVCTKCHENEARKLNHGNKIIYDKICTPCYHENLLERNASLRFKRDAKKSIWDDDAKALRNVICLKCKQNFITNHKTRSFCRNPCVCPTEEKKAVRSKMTLTEKWLAPQPIRKRVDSNKVAYSFFRKKYGPGDQFRTCGG